MKADLRGPKDLGTVIGFAYRVYLSNFRPLFLIALLTVPLQLLAAVVVDQSEAQSAELLALPIQAAQIVVFIVVSGALIRCVDVIASGAPVEAGPAIDAAMERFLALFTTNLLFSVLFLASVLAFPYTAVRYMRDVAAVEGGGWRVPGVLLGMFLYYWARWIFHPQAVMIDGKRNWSALDESAQSVQGRWWRTFGILLAVLAVTLGPGLIAGSASAAMPGLAGAIVLSVIVALVLPFLVSAQTLLYFDLKARREADANADRITAA